MALEPRERIYQRGRVIVRSHITWASYLVDTEHYDGGVTSTTKRLCVHFDGGFPLVLDGDDAKELAGELGL